MATQERIPVVLISITYGRNKPDLALYNLFKLPLEVVERIEASRVTNEKDWDKVSFGDILNDETAQNKRDEAIRAALIPDVVLSSGIPDHYHIKMCVGYLVQ